MGSLFRPKYGPKDDRKESSVWWLKYRARGRVIRESSETDNQKEALRLLKLREGAAAEGRAVVPRADRVTVAELADDLRNDYKSNERPSADRMERALAHLLPVFGHRRAAHVSKADVTAYVAQRQAADAANGTINRELTTLRRMFSLALEAEKLLRAPSIKKLREDNVRQGFFEREQFEAVRRHLPEYLKPVVTFAYVTGWRVRSEVLPLEWRRVDFKEGVVRLDTGTTKNREGREFYMTPELRACLEAQREATDVLQREAKRIIPWVFHRTKEAVPLGSFRKAWATACKAAGVPGRIPHDFRRSAVRNMERAGVPRSTAMKMVGHKTESMYRRYAIVDKAMLQEGAEKLARASTVASLGKDQGKVAGNTVERGA